MIEHGYHLYWEWSSLWPYCSVVAIPCRCMDNNQAICSVCHQLWIYYDLVFLIWLPLEGYRHLLTVVSFWHEVQPVFFAEMYIFGDFSPVFVVVRIQLSVCLQNHELTRRAFPLLLCRDRCSCRLLSACICHVIELRSCGRFRQRPFEIGSLRCPDPLLASIFVRMSFGRREGVWWTAYTCFVLEPLRFSGSLICSYHSNNNVHKQNVHTCSA